MKRKCGLAVREVQCAFFAFAFLLLTVLRFTVSEKGAETLDRAFGAPLRSFSGRLTSGIGFSVFGVLLALLPFALLFLVIRAVRASHTREGRIRMLCGLLTVFFLLSIERTLTVGFAFRKPTLSGALGLPEELPDAETRYAVLVSVGEELSSLCEAVSEGSKPNLSSVGVALSERFGTRVTVKPIFFSRLASRFGNLGEYRSLTGEITVNAEIPPSLLAVTAAHEYAHSLGYAREEDASLFAFLSLYRAEDPMLRYSALLHFHDELLLAFAEEDPEGYRAYLSKTDSRVKDEIASYSEYAEKNEASREIGDRAVDSVLRISGSGIASYDAFLAPAVFAYLRGASLP